MKKSKSVIEIVQTGLLSHCVCLAFFLFLCAGVTTAAPREENAKETPDDELLLSLCRKHPGFGNDGWDEYCGKGIPPDFMSAEFGPNITLEGNWMEEYRLDGRVVAARRVALFKSRIGYDSLLATPSRQDRLGPWSYSVADGWDIDDGGKKVGLNPPECTGRGCAVDAGGRLSVFQYRNAVFNRTGADRMIGTWAIHDNWNSRHEEGAVVSRRVYPRIDLVRFLGDKVDEVVPGGRTGVLEFQYQGGSYKEARANRRNVYVEVYGENLWGFHRLWIDRVHSLELSGAGYITRGAKTSGFRDQIIGITFKFVTWPGMFPGRKILWIDDIPIPFQLVLNDYPKENLPFAEQMNRIPPGDIIFLQRRNGSLVKTDKLYARDPFYVKVSFCEKPKQATRQVNLTFDSHQPVNIEVTESAFGPTVYDSPPLYLSQLTGVSFPKAEEPAPTEESLSATWGNLYSEKATARLDYAELLEGPAEKGPRKITATIDGLADSADIVVRGVSASAALEIPVELKLREVLAPGPHEFYLKVNPHALMIDPRMPEASTEILKQETQQILKRLADWRMPLKDKSNPRDPSDSSGKYKTQWLKEGCVTFTIAEPFEGLEKFSGASLVLGAQRTLDLTGDDLTQVVQLLYNRLMHKKYLEARIEAIMKKLRGDATLVQGVDKLDELLEDPEHGFENIYDYLFDFGRALADPYLGPFDSDRWFKDSERIEKDIADARGYLEKARENMLIKMGPPIEFQRRDTADRNAVNAVKTLKSCIRQAELRRNTLKNQPGLNAEARQRLQKRAQLFEKQAAEIQTIIDEHTASQKRRLDKFLADLDNHNKQKEQAKKAHQTASENIKAYQKDYALQREIHAKFIADIQTAFGDISPSFKSVKLSPLPRNLAELTPRRLNEAADRMIQARGSFRTWRSQHDETLAAHLSEYIEAQRSYALCMKNVTYAMKLAIRRARDATDDGSRADERTYQSLRKELDRVSGAIDEVEQLFSSGDSRLEKFQWLLDGLGTQEGKKIVEETRKEMETLGKIGKGFKKYADYADLLLRGVEAYDEDTPEAYLKYTLSVAAKAAERLPIRGGVLGGFLAFYAKAGSACLKAARNLSDEIIDNELVHLRDSNGKGAPEHHLYTQAQIQSEIFHGDNAERTREKVKHLTTMWQLRRLMYLLTHADDCFRIEDQRIPSN